MMNQSGSLDNFDIGISHSGIESLKEEIRIEILEKAQNALSGQFYQDMQRTLSSAWQGEDAEKFMKAQDERIETTKREMQTAHDHICEIFDLARDKWQKHRENRTFNFND